jgi:CheY-like chemotaxis protein
MDGRQLVREIRNRSEPALSLLPVIMLTAGQSERNILEGPRPGMTTL